MIFEPGETVEIRKDARNHVGIITSINMGAVNTDEDGHKHHKIVPVYVVRMKDNVTLSFEVDSCQCNTETGTFILGLAEQEMRLTQLNASSKFN